MFKRKKSIYVLLLPFVISGSLALLKASLIPSLSWWLVTSPVWGVAAAIAATTYGWWCIITIERLLLQGGSPRKCGNCEHCSAAAWGDGRYCFKHAKEVDPGAKPCKDYVRSAIADLLEKR